MKGLTLVILILTVFVVLCSAGEAKGWKQSEFIITMWCPPPADQEQLATLARDNYTLTSISPADPEEAINQLNMVEKAGIKTLVSSGLFNASTLDDPQKKAQLDTLIEKIKNFPALEGYFITDEPSATTFPTWAKITNYLKEKDPNHITYINLFPTYANQQQLGVFLTETPKGPLGIPDNFAGVGTSKDTIIFYNEHLRQYINTIKPDLISYDHYHFLRNGVDGGQYFLNLALIRQAALKAKRPFLNIIQSCTIEPSWRLPNKNELRWLAFTTLAYGGKGISWFLYWGPVSYGGCYQDGKRMPLADDVAGVNKDVLPIGNEMMKMESTEVYQTGTLPLGTMGVPVGSPVKVADGDFVIGLFKQNGIQNAFMTVNRDYKNISTAKLTLNFGKGQLQEFSPSTRKWEDIQFVQSGSTVSVTLNQADGKLFRVK